MILGFALFFMLLLIAGGVTLSILSKPKKFDRVAKQEDKSVEVKEEESGKTAHIEDLLPIEFIEDGIYSVGGLYCAMGKIEGTNFSVMSDHDQDIRESIFIDILNEIDFPVQFVTTSVVPNTGRAAQEIAKEAQKMPEGNLRCYSVLYAAALDDMHKTRKITSQSSWLVLTDDGSDGEPVLRLKEKVNAIGSALQLNAGIVFTPLQSTEEAMDVFGQILDNKSLVKSSKYLQGIQPIHLSEREVCQYIENQRTKTEYAA
ncbi:hypothetical protein ACOBQJ_03135 [Pelotomaculum propionicicum]|uniref:hypothetical protein n=1 Tax=Pelotomaculum propionicicum TaxID=258475 RepID=UPI003B807106